MDMDGDWPLPRPRTRFRIDRHRCGASLTSKTSIASTFSSLAMPVVIEVVQRTQSLATEVDPEAFHQLRVAFRKLRALYWAYSPWLGEEATAHASEEFKRLAAVAGGTRDWDIAGDLLKTAQKSDASIERLVSAAREKRAQAVAHSQTMIKSDAVEAFLNDAMMRAQTTLQSCCNDLPIRAFARRRVRMAQRTLRKRSRRAARSEAGHEENLHDVRKAGKKLRYLLEFFQPVIKGEHERTIKELTAVQKTLGEFNDIAASETLIRNTSFDEVPADVVEKSLQWLEREKCQRIDLASRKVKAISD
ncbi:CHAD domain-containing protein [Paraburkholderia silvatlantica]|uniref:CHAD domain-containing protein n=1 Tax=Paraburkholderia silvatlantica TaxID=321895 RepID=A0A2U1A0R9_9BURK|nr:CHAD domain-containing protein [Paraburkholderia silvatlantica]MBB2926409.1 CHAD domain-containing protein [Paraburkholderia silvatlantica]PVY25004.1 CHAD domain-containing protein [Paraburkholderia silvatlantica]PXW30088.1 CHAD domain-containing protein [Paraburkholderia silvatlantica]PYE16658.1 CHAD domain-containing protein [Paraburkholderia silvatlantica]